MTLPLKEISNLKNLGTRQVVVMDTLREKYPDKFNEPGAMDWKWFESKVRSNDDVYIRLDKNSISFTGGSPHTMILAVMAMVKSNDLAQSKEQQDKNHVAVTDVMKALSDAIDRLQDLGL